MADLSGGGSGLLARDYKGKEADRLVTRIDSGVVSPVHELRGHEPPGRRGTQWKTRVEARKPLDASPTAITLAMISCPETEASRGKRESRSGWLRLRMEWESPGAVRYTHLRPPEYRAATVGLMSATQ